MISVIISSYSLARLDDLKHLLIRLQRQTFKDFEIVLVLEKSRELYDQLGRFVRKQGLTSTSMIYNTGIEGLSADRNLGLSKAKGEIIAFIDDDAIPSDNWLENISIHLLDNPSVIGVTGPITPLFENESLKWLPEEFHWIISCMSLKTSEPINVRNAWGTNMTYRREAFTFAGNFNESLGIKGNDNKGWNAPGSEDTEFSLRVTKKTGCTIQYHPDIHVVHKVYLYRISWSFIARRALWEGCSKAMIKRIYKDSGTLNTESRLLKNIIFKLFPRNVFDLLLHPRTASKTLITILLILSSITVGYSYGKIRSIK